jgi:hypothetical protein
MDELIEGKLNEYRKVEADIRRRMVELQQDLLIHQGAILALEQLLIDFRTVDPVLADGPSMGETGGMEG